MKAANIVPIDFLDLLPESASYFMALAHLVGTSSRYSDFYEGKSATGATVILDNGVFELGKPMELGPLTHAITAIDPTIVVAPDYIYEPERSLWEATMFKSRAMSLKEERPDLQFMCVPHGYDYNEHVINAEELRKLDYFDVFGICKAPERLGVRCELAEGILKFSPHSVHMLGIYLDPVKEVLAMKELNAKYPGRVLGVDSSIAYALGMAGRTLLEASPRPAEPDFAKTKEGVHVKWVQRQIKAFQWLVESDCSSEEELEQEYKNGKF